MNLNSILKRRITLLLSAVMVLTSVIPTGIPVYAADSLLTEESLIVDDSYNEPASLEVLAEEEVEETALPCEDLITDDTLVNDTAAPASEPEEELIEDYGPDKGDPNPDTLSDNTINIKIQVSKNDIEYIEYEEYDANNNYLTSNSASYDDEKGCISFDISTSSNIVVTKIAKNSYKYEYSENFDLVDSFKYNGKELNPVLDDNEGRATWRIDKPRSTSTISITTAPFTVDDAFNFTYDGDYPITAHAYNYGGLTTLCNWSEFANYYVEGSFSVTMYPYDYDPDYTYSVSSAKYKGHDDEWHDTYLRYTLGYYQADFGTNEVARAALSGEKIAFHMTQASKSKTYRFTTYGDYGTIDPTGFYNGSKTNNWTAIYVNKGGKVNISTELREGYKLDSIVVSSSELKKVKKTTGSIPVVNTTHKTINDAATLSKITSPSGYDYTVNGVTDISLNTIAYAWADVRDVSSSSIPKTGDKYNLGIGKRAEVDFYYGDRSQETYNYTLLADGKDITAEAKASKLITEKKVNDDYWDDEKSDWITHYKTTLTLNPNADSSVWGQELNLCLSNSKGAASAVFLVEDANKRSVKLSKTSDTLPIGTLKRTYPAKVTGSFHPIVSIAGPEGYSGSAFNAYFSSDNKQLIITTTKDAPAGEYTLSVTDTVMCYSVMTVTLEADSVNNAVPGLKVISATNNKFTLNLNAGGIDTSLDGLDLEIIAVTDVSGNNLKTYICEIIPAATTTYDLWLSDDHSSTAGTATEYTVYAVLIQQNSNDTVIAKSNTASVKAKTMDGDIYTTSLKLKTGSSKVYSNMERDNACKIDVQYDNKASIKRLDRVELVYPNGTKETVTASNGSSSLHMEVSDSRILFWPSTGQYNNTSLSAGKYTITAYAAESSKGAAVAGSATVEVLQAIEDLYLESPERIIKLPNKAASVTLTAKTYDPSSSTLIKTDKVIWSIQGNDNISISKKGKITIPKNYRITSGTRFTVVCQANDYKGNPVTESVEITATGSYSNNTGFMFLDGSDYKARSAGSYTPSEFFNEPGGLADIFFAETDTFRSVDAKITVTGAKLIYSGNSYATIAFTKPGTVKITATATDGSGRKLTSSYKVEFSSSANTPVNFTLKDYSGTELKKHTGATLPSDTIKVTNSGTELMPMTLNVGYYSNDNTVLVDHKISVKGGKFTVSPYDAATYDIVPTARTTVITITDNASKTNNTATIEVTNTAIAAKKGKFKITASNKGNIYSHLDFSQSKNYGNSNRVTFTLANAGSATDALVTIKNDDSTNGDPIATAITNAGGIQVYENTYRIGLNSAGDGSKYFSLNFYDSSTYGFNITDGSYKLSVLPVITGTAGYTAVDKPKDVTVKAKKAPASKFTVTSKAFFKTGSGKITKGSTAIDKLTFSKVRNCMGSTPVFAGTYSMNKNGKINSFADNFDVKTDGTFRYVGNTEFDAKSKANGSELEGYVAVMYQTLEGTMETAYVKVTVSTKK